MSNVWQKVKAWVKGRVVDPFKEYIRQDAEPAVLARSATVGFLLGNCPVVGVSAGLCLLACFLFKSHLHAPMALLFNFIAVPIELLLIVPFMRFGELLLRAEPVHVIPQHFSDLFRPGEAVKGLGHAVVGWLIICAVLAWPSTLALTPAFAYFRKKFMALRRNDSDQGALLEGHAFGEDRSTISDVEMAMGTPSPTSPLAATRGSTLSPRSSSLPNGLSKFRPTD